MFRKALFGSAAIIVPSAVGLTILAKNDEGTERSLKFWYNVFPVYAHYRGIQLLNRDLKVMDDETADKLYSEAHKKYSDRIRDLTYEMRGFYLKQAQLMSIQDDFVPKEYMTWVKDTQDSVPSEFSATGAREYVEKLCKEELGKPFDEVFQSWDDVPLGVASIGEVHRAVLKSTGQVVAVKILVPGIEKKFKADIKTMKTFCELAMPQHAPAFDEIEKQFLTEFDYRREAGNLDSARKNVLKKWGADSDESGQTLSERLVKSITGNLDLKVVVPHPYLEYCSKHMLVMEFLDGIKLVDGIRNQYKKLAPLMGKTFEELEAENKALIESGTFKFKSLQEETENQKKTVVMLALQDIYRTNCLRFVYNYSPLRLIYGYWGYEWTERPIDLAPVIKKLSEVQAHSIFFDGEFNGDAHPGNILLLRDGSLGLIDYGQVKKMSIDSRIKYAKLIIAHSRRDEKEVVRLTFDELGSVTKYKKADICYKHSAFWNDRLTDDVTDGMNIATFIDWVEAQDPVVSLPEEYLFAARSSIMLRGLAKAFGINLIISELWREQANDFLRSQGIEY